MSEDGRKQILGGYFSTELLSSISARVRSALASSSVAVKSGGSSLGMVQLARTSGSETAEERNVSDDHSRRTIPANPATISPVSIQPAAISNDNHNRSR